MWTPGRTCFVVLGDCQKIISRPRARVITNCERFSRARSTTRSMAALRRVQGRTGSRTTNFGVIRPAGGSVAVELGGSWPGVLGLSTLVIVKPAGPSGIRTRGECGILLWIERDRQIVRHLHKMADVWEEIHGPECLSDYEPSCSPDGARCWCSLALWRPDARAAIAGCRPGCR
jgi:hypothetical protein